MFHRESSPRRPTGSNRGGGPDAGLHRRPRFGQCPILERHEVGSPRGAYEGLGVISKWRGELDGAIPLFRKTASLDPNYSAAYCDLAGALAALGQTSEALAILHNFRERLPEDRLVAELEKAIQADAAGKHPATQ